MCCRGKKKFTLNLLCFQELALIYSTKNRSWARHGEIRTTCTELSSVLRNNIYQGLWRSDLKCSEGAGKGSTNTKAERDGVGRAEVRGQKEITKGTQERGETFLAHQMIASTVPRVFLYKSVSWFPHQVPIDGLWMPWSQNSDLFISAFPDPWPWGPVAGPRYGINEEMNGFRYFSKIVMGSLDEERTPQPGRNLSKTLSRLGIRKKAL